MRPLSVYKNSPSVSPKQVKEKNIGDQKVLKTRRRYHMKGCQETGEYNVSLLTAETALINLYVRTVHHILGLVEAEMSSKTEVEVTR